MSAALPRRAFDALEDGLAPLATLQPRLALAAAGALGRLRNRLSRRWPSPRQVAALFPRLGERAAARVAWEIGALEARNRVLVACIRSSGLDAVAPLVRAELSGLRPPLVLGTFHVGAVHALGAALPRLPGAVLALRHGLLYEPRPPVEVVSTEGDDQQRAAAFHRALAHLGRGGFVVTALDVVPGPGYEARCLGRTLRLARGPFALARLAGAPLAPLVARWRQDGTVDVAAGPPLAAAGDPASGPAQALAACSPAEAAERERALAAAAALWLERHLLAAPGEIGLGLLRALLGEA